MTLSERLQQQNINDRFAARVRADQLRLQEGPLRAAWIEGYIEALRDLRKAGLLT